MIALHEDASVHLFPVLSAWATVYFVFKNTVAAALFSENGPKTYGSPYPPHVYRERRPWIFVTSSSFPLHIYTPMGKIFKAPAPLS